MTGSQLTQYRESVLKMTQEFLAAVLGMHHMRVSRAERSKELAPEWALHLIAVGQALQQAPPGATPQEIRAACVNYVLSRIPPDARRPVPGKRGRPPVKSSQMLRTTEPRQSPVSGSSVDSPS